MEWKVQIDISELKEGNLKLQIFIDLSIENANESKSQVSNILNMIDERRGRVRYFRFSRNRSWSGG